MKTCINCKYYDAKNCWCDLHEFDKAFLDETCENFKNNPKRDYLGEAFFDGSDIEPPSK